MLSGCNILPVAPPPPVPPAGVQFKFLLSSYANIPTGVKLQGRLYYNGTQSNPSGVQHRDFYATGVSGYMGNEYISEGFDAEKASRGYRVEVWAVTDSGGDIEGHMTPKATADFSPSGSDLYLIQ